MNKYFKRNPNKKRKDKKLDIRTKINVLLYRDHQFFLHAFMHTECTLDGRRLRRHRYKAVYVYPKKKTTTHNLYNLYNLYNFNNECNVHVHMSVQKGWISTEIWSPSEKRKPCSGEQKISWPFVIEKEKNSHNNNSRFTDIPYDLPQLINHQINYAVYCVYGKQVSNANPLRYLAKVMP